MALEIVSLQLGPMENNTYLAADTDSGQAVVIDPSFESESILPVAAQRGWQLTAVWLTHAHFDHFAGVEAVSSAFTPPLPVGLHPDDLDLWRQGGGARLFGIQITSGPEPSFTIAHQQVLTIGTETLEVRHAPGHTPGHVIFYSAAAGIALCGDVIFYHGIGRTDLPGGSASTLLESIRNQVLTLPPGTRLLSGHGPETTVQEEQRENPFL